MLSQCALASGLSAWPLCAIAKLLYSQNCANGYNCVRTFLACHFLPYNDMLSNVLRQSNAITTDVSAAIAATATPPRRCYTLSSKTNLRLTRASTCVVYSRSYQFTCGVYGLWILDLCIFGLRILGLPTMHATKQIDVKGYKIYTSTKTRIILF